ncbi:MAG: hypothetical protein K6G01_11400 [Eubacterium sp.]|nr:hypothetical protein [Eubacterium sp.]
MAITVMINSDDWSEVSYQVRMESPLKIIVSEKHPWYHMDTVSVDEGVA